MWVIDISLSPSLCHGPLVTLWVGLTSVVTEVWVISLSIRIDRDITYTGPHVANPAPPNKKMHQQLLGRVTQPEMTTHDHIFISYKVYIHEIVFFLLK
jgi:hypothetical protein